MKNIGLKIATAEDRAMVIDFDYRLDKFEHKELGREKKITKAISNNECFIIVADKRAIGFILFDYRFFGRGWIELIVVDEKHRGEGIGSKALELICLQSRTDKVFTSTNQSNTPMQKALSKAGYTYAGEIIGLDEGDPELFYFKTKSSI